MQNCTDKVAERFLILRRRKLGDPMVLSTGGRSPSKSKPCKRCAQHISFTLMPFLPVIVQPGQIRKMSRYTTKTGQPIHRHGVLAKSRYIISELVPMPTS